MADIADGKLNKCVHFIGGGSGVKTNIFTDNF
jgi:hypothetical protein